MNDGTMSSRDFLKSPKILKVVVEVECKGTVREVGMQQIK
jgi:hypothetical protein